MLSPRTQEGTLRQVKLSSLSTSKSYFSRLIRAQMEAFRNFRYLKKSKLLPYKDKTNAILSKLLAGSVTRRAEFYSKLANTSNS